METDLEAMINIRAYIENILVEAGVEVTDAGMVMQKNRADLGIEVEGMPYSIHIIPRNILLS